MAGTRTPCRSCSPTAASAVVCRPTGSAGPWPNGSAVDGLHAIGNTSAKAFGPAAGATVRRRDASAGPLRLVLNVPQAVMTTGAGLGRSQSGLIALG